MANILKIALRNLFRYKRRTYLTTSLIAIGVIIVIAFGGIAGSFKNGVIGILTNSNLADIQIHKNGYLKSIDNLPLDLTIDSKGIAKIEGLLKKNDQVVTIGGIHGKVVSVRGDEVMLKLDKKGDVRVTFNKSAVSRIVTGDDQPKDEGESPISEEQK